MSPLPFGKTLSKISYKLLDAIICQSKDMADELIELRPKISHKVHIINNPITKYEVIINKYLLGKIKLELCSIIYFH